MQHIDFPNSDINTVHPLWAETFRFVSERLAAGEKIAALLLCHFQ